jgi:flagellar FliL protein
MADEDIENEDIDENENENESGNKKKIILFVVIGLILISFSVGSTLFALSMLSAEPEVTTEKFDEEGNPIEQLDEEGNPIEQLDEEGNPIEQLDEEGNPIEQLDEEGNPIKGVESEEDVTPVVEEKGYAIYFPLKPAIVVNFQARGRQRFLQANVTLMTRDDEVIEAIEMHMPMIRNALVLKFGSQTYEEMQTEQGRELLRQESLEELQNIMLQEIDKTGIEKLLFTNFVMQ